jgi:hypothetical protein
MGHHKNFVEFICTDLLISDLGENPKWCSKFAPEERPGQAQELTLTHRKVLSALAHLHPIGLKRGTHKIISITPLKS